MKNLRPAQLSNDDPSFILKGWWYLRLRESGLGARIPVNLIFQGTDDCSCRQIKFLRFQFIARIIGSFVLVFLRQILFFDFIILHRSFALSLLLFSAIS